LPIPIIEEDLMNQLVFSHGSARQEAVSAIRSTGKVPNREALRFDALARSLGAATSRRRVIGGMLGTLGLGALSPLVSEAKNHKRKHKKNKTKKTPLVLNQFGCVSVGGKCKGSNANCCSGVCHGKKPERGEGDKSRCVEHNQDSCTAERNFCVQNPGDLSVTQCNAANPEAVCVVATGNANFCASFTGATKEGNCRDCSRDTDCTAAGFPPGTACVQLGTTGPCGTTCVDTGGRICLPPGI
jgi:hypothetical protein